MKDRKNKGMRKVFIRQFLAEALDLRDTFVGKRFKGFGGRYQPDLVLRYLKLHGYVPDPNKRKD